MRADALRNRTRILERAGELLARSGTAAGMEEIAEAAGVGIGTLYRHFPDKAALVDALAADRLEAVIADARRLADAHTGAGRILTVLDAYTEQAARDGALRFALTGPHRAGPTLVEDVIGASAPVIQSLIDADIADGLLRPDLDFAAFQAVCAAVILTMDAPLPDGAWRRVFEVIRDGLRP